MVTKGESVSRGLQQVLHFVRGLWVIRQMVAGLAIVFYDSMDRKRVLGIRVLTSFSQFDRRVLMLVKGQGRYLIRV